MRNGLTPEQDATAAELALGVLEGEERAEAQRLCLADPAFAAAVEDWRLQLGVLHETVADEPPPSGVWSAIDARLEMANSAETVSKLRFWRRSAWASSAVAAALAAALLFPGTPDVRTVVLPPAQSAIAQLNGEAGAILAASYTPQAGQLQIRPVDLPDSKLSPELWLIPADGKPRSLGLVEPGASKSMPMSPDMTPMITEGAQLAVSVEPLGGSKLDVPSGPVAAIGMLAKI